MGGAGPTPILCRHLPHRRIAAENIDTRRRAPRQHVQANRSRKTTKGPHGGPDIHAVIEIRSRHSVPEPTKQRAGVSYRIGQQQTRICAVRCC